ncbi:MAG TPA: hypothetical protein VFU22_15765 [Roseiflexaceae bacterium]|nr:hypothetical protein [Roseiflexaceae bacterium]
MPNRVAYPRSSARPIYLTASVLGLLGLAGVIMMLIAMADVPKQSYYLLIAAFGLLTVALAGALAMLLATNTRRPWGIDPNIGPHSRTQAQEEVDPYATSTEDLLRHAVQLPDGNGYGRRQSDDPTVVRRLASIDQPLPPKLDRPAWATEMLPPAYREEPPAAESKEPAEPFTEIPLDQLDLMPAEPASINQNERRVDTEA